jgi:hypothetical protein
MGCRLPITRFRRLSSADSNLCSEARVRAYLELAEHRFGLLIATYECRAEGDREGEWNGNQGGILQREQGVLVQDARTDRNQQ